MVLGAYLWQLLPKQVSLRLQGWPRLADRLLSSSDRTGTGFVDVKSPSS